MQAISDIIKPRLQSFQKQFVGFSTFFGNSFFHILSELPLADAVVITSFLFFEHLYGKLAFCPRSFSGFFSASLSKREFLSLGLFKKTWSEPSRYFIFWFI